MNLIRFNSQNKSKIWGKEDWIISAHDNGMSYIKDGEFKGMALKDFFNHHSNLLGTENLEQFPLLVKIIVANDDLSIQVHPNNEYALKTENELGKSECWFILDAQNTDIVVGQHAKNSQELLEAIQEDNLMSKLNVIGITKGDFFYIPSGCVHAIRKNTRILEIQQSSNITYRLYDYKRLDRDGKTRELHVNKSLDVIDYDFEIIDKKRVASQNASYIEEILTDNEYFIVKKIEVKKEYELYNEKIYTLGILIEGSIQFDSQALEINEGFLVLKNQKVNFKGTGTIIISTSK